MPPIESMPPRHEDKKKEVGRLVVVVLKARNLPDKHSFSKQDPYCEVELSNSDKQTTSTQTKGGQHPVWDEQFTFIVYEKSEGEVQKLSIKTFRKEPVNDELIGEGTVNIERNWENNEFDEWVPLAIGGKYKGEVFLEMTFYPPIKPSPKPLPASPSQPPVQSAASPQSQVYSPAPGQQHQQPQYPLQQQQQQQQSLSATAYLGGRLNGPLQRRPSKLDPSTRLAPGEATIGGRPVGFAWVGGRPLSSNVVVSGPPRTKLDAQAYEHLEPLEEGQLPFPGEANVPHQHPQSLSYGGPTSPPPSLLPGGGRPASLVPPPRVSSAQSHHTPPPAQPLSHLAQPPPQAYQQTASPYTSPQRVPASPSTPSSWENQTANHVPQQLPPQIELSPQIHSPQPQPHQALPQTQAWSQAPYQPATPQYYTPPPATSPPYHQPALIPAPVQQTAYSARPNPVPVQPIYSPPPSNIYQPAPPATQPYQPTPQPAYSPPAGNYQNNPQTPSQHYQPAPTTTYGQDAYQPLFAYSSPPPIPAPPPHSTFSSPPIPISAPHYPSAPSQTPAFASPSVPAPVHPKYTEGPLPDTTEYVPYPIRQARAKAAAEAQAALHPPVQDYRPPVPSRPSSTYGFLLQSTSSATSSPSRNEFASSPSSSHNCAASSNSYGSGSTSQAQETKPDINEGQMAFYAMIQQTRDDAAFAAKLAAEEEVQRNQQNQSRESEDALSWRMAQLLRDQEDEEQRRREEQRVWQAEEDLRLAKALAEREQQDASSSHAPGQSIAGQSS